MFRVALLLIACVMTPFIARAETPDVIVTIKPLHALVSAVMKDVAEPKLLIQGAASPHTYNLKPSDVRALIQTQMIVWTGEALEPFLGKIIKSTQKAQLIEVTALPGLKLLSNRKSGAFEDHEKKTKGVHQHDHGDIDPHLWLDPNNAKIIVQAIGEALSAIDPTHQDIYKRNVQDMLAALEQLDREIAAATAPLRNIPFIVFHDAYQYFEARYGLTAVGSITLNPERAPGAKGLQHIRAKIAQTKARCVFSEPQFEPALVRTVTEGSQARIGTLDPIGANIPAGIEAYAALLRQLTTSFKDCLRPGS